MLGARMHYAVPRLLHEAGLLSALFTDSYVGNKPWLRGAIAALPPRFRAGEVARFAGRSCEQLPPNRVFSDEALGLRFAFQRRRVRTPEAVERLYADAAAHLARNVVRRNFAGAGIVWGFNTASAELFAAAKERGLRCILEQTYLPYAHEADLLRREAADWPGWQPQLYLPAGDRLQVQRERMEWERADMIVGGSQFVAEGLETCGVDRERIRVIPYGVDPARFQPPELRDDGAADGPLRVLFVGEVGLRKGVPYLLEALAALGPQRVEARFAGNVVLDPERLCPYADVATFLGAVPRLQMPELFRWAHVLVLPSIIEGSATVVYEALLSGLPVVVTPNTGSIVTHDMQGHVVPIRDAGAIARALRAYAEDGTLRRRHAAAAADSLAYAGLNRYGQDLRGLIRDVGKA